MAGSYHGNEYVVYYDSEGTRGTIDASATWTPIAQHAKVGFLTSATAIGVHESGSKDKADQGKGPYLSRVKISLVPNSVSFAWLKNFITTNQDDTFSMVLKENDEETFQTLAGCVIASWNQNVSIWPNASAVNWEVEVVGRTVAFAEPTTPTYTGVTSSFYNWSDVSVKLGASGGAASAITNHLSSRFTLTNQVDAIPDNTGAPTDIRVGTRTHSGQVIRSVTDSGSTEFGELVAGTKKRVEFLLGSDTITFDKCLWEEVELDADRGTMAQKLLSFSGGTLTLA